MEVTDLEETQNALFTLKKFNFGQYAVTERTFSLDGSVEAEFICRGYGPKISYYKGAFYMEFQGTIFEEDYSKAVEGLAEAKRTIAAYRELKGLCEEID